MSVSVWNVQNLFQAIVARLRGHRSGTGRRAKEQVAEVTRIRAAMSMHDLGVQMYRQRMYREHPQANQGEIDFMVRKWLTEPPRNGHLRLHSED